MELVPLEGEKIVFIKGAFGKIFRLNDVLYVESVSRERGNFIRLTFMNGSAEDICGTLCAIVDSNASFFRINRQFCANINHADRVDGRDLVMKNNDRIKFSRREYYAFCDKMGNKLLRRKKNKRKTNKNE